LQRFFVFSPFVLFVCCFEFLVTIFFSLSQSASIACFHLLNTCHFICAYLAIVAMLACFCLLVAYPPCSCFISSSLPCVFVCLLILVCCLFTLFSPLLPLLLCVLTCYMFALFMSISSSLPCSPTCYLFALFAFAPPLSHCVCAHVCLLFFHLVRAYSTIIALRVCLQLLATYSPCSRLFCHHCIACLFFVYLPCSRRFRHYYPHVYYMFALFTFVPPSPCCVLVSPTCYLFPLFMFASPSLPTCLLPIHLLHTYFAIINFWPSRFKYQALVLPLLPYVFAFTCLLFKYKFIWFVKLSLLIIHLSYNHSLGLAIKSRASKGAGREGNLGVTFHVLESVGERGKMNPHILK
jgi:hypothetical protein